MKWNPFESVNITTFHRFWVWRGWIRRLAASLLRPSPHALLNRTVSYISFFPRLLRDGNGAGQLLGKAEKPPSPVVRWVG